ncbi:oxidoreductase [Pseudorhodoferax aquiterrae]|uniref:Oxidoreductase n=1 Tax=Pseudorhodoferax aquiterrae TaxID=747304 RepID=A0ABQ3G7G7_9BURK|nr:FAD/NAD(P)-binding oxidoreductase [Pseudorhodoferax aquiterrae]GHC93493.1 oxidoreductase [Pseudorhodoferax aquiterrae]
MRLEHCDVAIVGAGPAGLAAADVAAASGARTVLLDDNPAPGGQIWRDGPGVRLPAVARRLRARVQAHAQLQMYCGVRVVAAPADDELLLEDAEQAWRLRWGRLVLATGARELLLPFPGWTLPGVTGAGGLQALVKAGMPVAGERIVVAGSGPLLLAAATTARQAGAQVLRVAEQAAWPALARFALGLPRWPGKAWQALGLRSAGYRAGWHAVAALGEGQLRAVRLQGPGGQSEEIACDRLACGFGLVPNTELGRLLGCATVERHGLPALSVDDWQATSRPRIHAAGECTGVGGSERAHVQGAIAGHAAVGQNRQAQTLRHVLAHWDRFAERLHQAFALGAPLRQLATPETLLCRCEDVPLAALAGCTDWTEAKLQTRCGMGACQGRVCGAAAQLLFGWAPPQPRAPLVPVRVGTLADLGDRGDDVLI